MSVKLTSIMDHITRIIHSCECDSDLLNCERLISLLEDVINKECVSFTDFLDNMKILNDNINKKHKELAQL